MVAAVATSAAAGKNPWLPLGMIFLLAAPGSVPELMMNADLHRQLHALAPVEVLTDADEERLRSALRRLDEEEGPDW